MGHAITWKGSHTGPWQKEGKFAIPPKSYERLKDLPMFKDNFLPDSHPNNEANQSKLVIFSSFLAVSESVIASIWLILAASYLVARWRQKSKSTYIIPRVFVLCSPRTVQFHYELILRIGLPSSDFNSEKHDVDISLLGQQKNEVVPVTRLNTKTLQDEPLITNLSLVVYRLVEMPALGGIVLKHSGPFKAWLYAYDFTVVDLITNREYYYALNQYIGALERVLPLDEPNLNNPVEYPIDDVPLPQWSIEDIFLILFTTINFVILVICLLPINCSYSSDLISVILGALGGGTILFFLVWLLYYHLSWNQDRKEYFNEAPVPSAEQQAFGASRFSCSMETMTKIVVAIFAVVIGCAIIYLTLGITDKQDALVWALIVLNSSVMVLGFWNLTRQMELGAGIINLGLRARGIEEQPVGIHYSDMANQIRTKSGSSTSDDGITSNMSGVQSTKTNGGRLLGPRSSVKSFGFEPISAHKSKFSSAKRPRIMSRLNNRSRLSATGATPNNQPSGLILRPLPSPPENRSRIGHHASDTPSMQHPASPRSHLSRLTGSKIEGLDSTKKQKSTTEQYDSSNKPTEKSLSNKEQSKTLATQQGHSTHLREKSGSFAAKLEKTGSATQTSKSLSNTSASLSGSTSNGTHQNKDHKS